LEGSREWRSATPADAGISIEPHMVVVFHDAQSKASDDEAMGKNYVEYGRRLEKMIGWSFQIFTAP